MKLPFSRKKLRFLLPFLFLSVFFLLGAYAIHIITPATQESYRTGMLEKMEHAASFSDFTNALFCYEVTSDSITTTYTLKNPADYQIPTLPPTLSSFTNKEYRKHSSEKLLTLLSDTLQKFEGTETGEKDAITLSLLQRHIALKKELDQYSYYESLLGSSTGVQANLPVTLGEYPLRCEEDIRAYLSLLTQLPDYFKNVISYEKTRTSLGREIPDFSLAETKEGLTPLLESLRGENNCFTATFEERLAKLKTIPDDKKKQYQKQNRNYIKKYVLPAYENLYDYVEHALKDSIASGRRSHTHSEDNTSSDENKNLLPHPQTSYGLSSFEGGAEYYSLLVKDNTGSNRSVPELIQMTEDALKQALADVLNIALTDQQAYLYYCDHPITTYYQTPEAILEALSLMLRGDYPVLKNPPSYQVKTVPDSLASSLSPAFYMLPAIDDYENNTIYINPLYTNEEAGNLFTTLAHEGFPGHLYQTVYFNETEPDPIRQLLDYPGYVEGWATYVELNSFTFLDYPLAGDSLCRLYQADTIINLALCSRIDMGVNYESWTLDDVSRFFEDNGFHSYFATDVYTYVVEAPSVYLRYFIGYLEIENLKEAYRHEKMENFSEKDFHTRLLDIGPADFETIREYMLHQ